MTFPMKPATSTTSTRPLYCIACVGFAHRVFVSAPATGTRSRGLHGAETRMERGEDVRRGGGGEEKERMGGDLVERLRRPSKHQPGQQPA